MLLGMLSIVCPSIFWYILLFIYPYKKYVETSFNIYHLTIYIFSFTLFGFYCLAGITI